MTKLDAAACRELPAVDDSSTHILETLGLWDAVADLKDHAGR
jgi:hypothetical protein